MGESKVVIEDGHSWIDVTEMRLSFEYTVYYQHWTRFIVLGILPLFLLCFLNLRIFTQVFINRSSNTELSYFLITLLIVSIFILCHLPRLALNFYEALDSAYIGMCGPPVWSLLLPVCNSTANFFVYFLAGTAFRGNMVRMLTCRAERGGAVFSKSSAGGDREVTEMEELEQTTLLRL